MTCGGILSRDRATLRPLNPPHPRSSLLSPECRPERGWVGLQLSCPPPSASRFSPAFLSFLFLYTDRITSKLPSRSTTMVKIRMTAKVEATQGGLSKVSWSLGPEPFKGPLPLTDMLRGTLTGRPWQRCKVGQQNFVPFLRPSLGEMLDVDQAGRGGRITASLRLPVPLQKSRAVRRFPSPCAPSRPFTQTGTFRRSVHVPR